MALAYLHSHNIYLLAFMVYGFLARVVAGPSLSPIALLVTKIIIPQMGNPYAECPGPPKRFAQFVGLIFTSSAFYFIISDKSTIAYLLEYSPYLLFLSQLWDSVLVVGSLNK